MKSENKKVKDCLEKGSSKVRAPTSRGEYNDYTPKLRAQIGKYAAKNGPTKAAKHFSQRMYKTVSESTARRLKIGYLSKLRALE